MGETKQYKITFFSEWHCGSGLSSGFGVGQLVLRDKDGLPFIPGRTLKGLLRDAAECLTELSRHDKSSWISFTDTVFGTREGAAKRNYVPSPCFFSDGQLKEDIQQHLREDEELKTFLFRETASTAIALNGTALERSLRVKETVIPLVLKAEIANFPNADGSFHYKLLNCMKWIKRLGVNRNRGLGRCAFELIPTGGETE